MSLLSGRSVCYDRREACRDASSYFFVVYYKYLSEVGAFQYGKSLTIALLASIGIVAKCWTWLGAWINDWQSSQI